MNLWTPAADGEYINNFDVWRYCSSNVNIFDAQNRLLSARQK